MNEAILLTKSNRRCACCGKPALVLSKETYFCVLCHNIIVELREEALRERRGPRLNNIKRMQEQKQAREGIA